ncbi:MAG: transposase [Opitutales bacterium]|nr:transposase [Opitutales bacterium]
MPRKTRIEYPGAIYHIISRGNYRKDLFTIGKLGEAFEKALFEVTERCRWKIHAYVIMSNHYHLALELTEPNMVDGMRWLQSTFANRFNRFTGERGHVFQGRYKAILIEPERPLLGLVNYIHLNPVRAGVVSTDELKKYKLSSYPKFFKKTLGLGLCREEFLSILNLPDSLYGMRRYTEHLKVSEESVSGRTELARKYCRGWILAGKKFREELLKSYGSENPSPRIEAEGRKAMKSVGWEESLVKLLETQSKTEDDILRDRKGADWKVVIAKEMRRSTTASNPWLADHLNMGHPSRVSNLVNGSF